MGANADTVKNGWDAFARGDMDAATATTSDSAEIVVPESLPWGGTYTGPDGFKEMIGKLLSNFDELRPNPQEFIEADGGRVLVTVSGVGTTKSGNESAATRSGSTGSMTARSSMRSSTATPPRR